MEGDNESLFGTEEKYKAPLRKCSELSVRKKLSDEAVLPEILYTIP